MGRRGAVQREFCVPGQPCTLALYGHYPRGEAAERGGLKPPRSPLSFREGRRAQPIHSSRGDVDDRFGKGVRGFLRQIVSNAARDGPVLISAREFFHVGTGLRMWCAI